MGRLRLGRSFIVLLAFIIAVLMIVSSSNLSNAQSPYTSQLNSPVRGLSAQEVDDLINGRGAGYARTAELNHYPGPKHVLDMKQELALSPEQEQQIEVIFSQMNMKAKQVGREIVEHEQQFSNVFAQGEISESDINEQARRLGMLYGQYRSIHLQPHLKVRQLLSPEQIAKYDQLQGYSNLQMQSEPSSPAHHH